MGGYKLEIKGINDVLAKLDVDKFEKDIQAALDDFGLRVVKQAKILAPVDEGRLRQSINSTPGKLSVTIDVNVDYAAYIEFGTRKFAAAYVSSLPPDWQAFAAQFKGASGGSFAEMIQNLMKWVKRKGIDEKAAYPIVLKILREGVRPHPFLYPSVENQRAILIKDLENLL